MKLASQTSSCIRVIQCNLLKAREKSRVQIVIGFPSYKLIHWREIFNPITKRSNCNRVISFDKLNPTNYLLLTSFFLTHRSLSVAKVKARDKPI